MVKSVLQLVILTAAIFVDFSVGWIQYVKKYKNTTISDPFFNLEVDGISNEPSYVTVIDQMIPATIVRM